MKTQESCGNLHTLNMDIIGACNLRCEYCYNSDREGKLSVEDVLGYGKKYSPQMINIGGGEPMLHDGLAEIVEELSKSHKVSISTNGTILVSPLLNLPEQLRENISIQVSLPASERGLYQKITGTDKLDEVLKNIAVYNEHFSTAVNSPIYADNFICIDGLIGICKGLGVPLRLSLVVPVGNAKDARLIGSQQLARMQYLAVKGALDGVAYSPVIGMHSCPILYNAYGIGVPSECNATNGQKIYIDPHGNKSACEFKR